MTEQAVQIIARGPRALAEAAAEAIDADPMLEGATYSILEEDEDRGIWRIDAFPTSTEEAEGIEASLIASGGLTVVVEALADADWLAMALSGLPPGREGRFFVYGLHAPGRAPGHPVQVPNQGLGGGAALCTGLYEPPAGGPRAYTDRLKARRFGRVLDVGCGTGVLAIAAARTGSKKAVGTDIDGPSVRIANENAIENAAKARFVHASGLNHRLVRQDAPYDLVFANILAPPLVALAQDIKGALRPGGVAILSGLLRTQERRVKAAYLSKGFRVVRRIHRDAWATLVLQRA